MRLTIPRRVYTDRHMDVIINALAKIWERRDTIKGLDFEYEPKILRHFLCRLHPIGDGTATGSTPDVKPMVP